MEVTIVVTHLLGTGHLARALTLGRAFVAAGDTVTVISGGKPVPHFDSAGLTLVHLPPLQSNGTDFSTLLTDAGEVADDAYLAARQATLLDHIVQQSPDVLITELFPFGRRTLKAEFQALLEAADGLPSRPLILSSIRDILAPPSKPAKVTFADQFVDRFYDAVLVHSDPEVVTLDASWPVSERLRPKLRYTGFVAPGAPDMIAPRHSEILVSAGGGDVGDKVFEAACEAAKLNADHSWRFLVGGDDARRTFWANRAPANVVVEGPRPDFRELLVGATASVSMCGYNTALDVLQTGVPAVFVPFDDGGEVEQGLRADALATLPAVSVVRQANLSGPTLADAIGKLAQQERRSPRTTGMTGAKTSVEIVHGLLVEASHAN
ncbi:glycosyl transferase [Tateyamaria omphalii]|uniref:glycosyltransferase family protein n=1 Tax=Tateyamaria omphalii TaxID=299262 RepID=UPI00167B620D|nr:glycosyltransferase [Tateyamaria omphalii]GGX58795.1 glycosyl transferase [Tateyamaria omphalii]